MSARTSAHDVNRCCFCHHTIEWLDDWCEHGSDVPCEVSHTRCCHICTPKDATTHTLSTGTSRGFEGRRMIAYGRCACGWGTTNSANRDSVLRKHRKHLDGTATEKDGFYTTTPRF